MVPTNKGANVILYSHKIQMPAPENRYIRVPSWFAMKTVVLDFGNTSLKYGLFEGDQLIEANQFSMLSVEELIPLCERMKPEACVIASSGISLEPYLQGLTARWKTFEVSNQTPVPIDIEYKTPNTLGVDRLAAAVAAAHRFPKGSALVIDCGTCITYEVVQEKVYRGGAISPGLQMRLGAMNHFTARLPLIEKGPPESFWPGQSTQESLWAGALKGWQLEIKGFIELQRHQSSQLNVILTGGDAHYFESSEKMGIFADPFHVLRGLNEIFGYNAKTL